MLLSEYNRWTTKATRNDDEYCLVNIWRHLRVGNMKFSANC